MQHRRFWFVFLVLVTLFSIAGPALAQDAEPVDPTTPSASPDVFAQNLEPVDPDLSATFTPSGDFSFAGASSSKIIPNRYIVVFKAGTTNAVIDEAIATATTAATDELAGVTLDANLGSTIDAATTGISGLVVHHRYDDALQGFAATLSLGSLQSLKNHPAVEYIEPDQIMTATTIQTPVNWNLDRLDQRNLPVSNTYSYVSTGTGVTVYILDTGIRYTHTEFGGRASLGYDALSGGGNGSDCNGHGTHVAGTVGGVTYGVAKNVKLKSVRVLSCVGSAATSTIIAGVNWVSANAVKPAIANMSLGGPASTALDTAVKNALSKNITFTIAAGNENADACNSSPARVTDAITVGATAPTDAKASWSNYGICLDLFAPGVQIISAWYTNDTATVSSGGTSMAAPHAAGVAALYLQRYPTSTPKVVRNSLVSYATPNVVVNPGTNSPNRLLFTGY